MGKEKSEGCTAYWYNIGHSPYKIGTRKDVDWWAGWYSAREEDTLHLEEEWR